MNCCHFWPLSAVIFVLIRFNPVFLPLFCLFILMLLKQACNMGNSESMYEAQDNFHQHPPSYDGSSVNDSYHQPSTYAGSLDSTTTYHQPSSYAGTSANTSHHQSSSHATSSVNTHHQHKNKKHPTYIADNFSSLDQVFTATFTLERIGGVDINLSSTGLVTICVLH